MQGMRAHPQFFFIFCVTSIIWAKLGLIWAQLGFPQLNFPLAHFTPAPKSREIDHYILLRFGQFGTNSMQVFKKFGLKLD